MKHLKHISARSMALALAAIIFVCSASFAQAPIPGINIIIKKNGKKKKTQESIAALPRTSDKNGQFSYSALAGDTYALEFPNDLAPRTKGKGYDTLKPFRLRLAAGNTVVVDGKPWDSALPIIVKVGMTIEITAGKGGKISGVCTTDGINGSGPK